MALQKVAVDNTVIISQASCDYLDFAENWILHAQEAEVRNWLMIVEDEPSLHYLGGKYGEHIIPVDLMPDFTLKNTTNFIKYGGDDFRDLMCNRLIYQHKILEEGFSVVWTDIDTAWFENPMSLFPKGYDYIGVDDQWPWVTKEQDSDRVCGCLTVWAPTPLGLETHKAWVDKCLVSPVDDQDTWNGMFKGELRQKLNYYIMPRQLFPTGLNIDMMNFAPQEDRMKPTAIPPVWIHANYRIGQERKHNFFKKNKAWKIEPGTVFPQCKSDE